ncbi:hypothetical protein ATANTOWER_014385 [Ataeniobius toweri]|uniref:Uncharacterized protein n=1 Tax=Ataeniobius toweri TaxID=208326 RepID=A0ABU7AHN8_9TELE|nr:hypothetical protein [Ataeniobius toweri]
METNPVLNCNIPWAVVKQTMSLSIQLILLDCVCVRVFLCVCVSVHPPTPTLNKAPVLTSRLHSYPQTFTYWSELEMCGCQKGGVKMESGQNDGGQQSIKSMI